LKGASQQGRVQAYIALRNDGPGFASCGKWRKQYIKMSRRTWAALAMTMLGKP